MTTLIYNQTPEFSRDVKKLSKKWRSLLEDLETVKRNVIELYHSQNINASSVFPITGCITNKAKAYIVKKFACKSLKGKGSHSGIRLTYIYFTENNSVLFTELFYKGDQEIEDRARIHKYL